MEEQIEQLFTWIDETTTIIEKEENTPYIEALIASTELLFDPKLPENLKDDYANKLMVQLEKINIDQFELEARRKAMQLAILKGMKGATQEHHYITPDTIGLFIGYLVQKFMDGKTEFELFDPACGTANLLLSVMNQQKDVDVQAFGSEVDPTLIRLAYNNANLLEKPIELFHQDSLKPILLEPVDVVVSDLPVGYYPDDLTSQGYQLKAEEGHSLSHLLFIELRINYTKEGGYLLLLVPSFLFSSDEAMQVHSFLNEHAHIVGLLELPDSMFKNERYSKSIFILQKKGPTTSNPKKALLVELPSFKDVKAMDYILNEINKWFVSEKG